MQQRSEETRARILDSAVKCFSQSGYEASGVAEICAAAGVSKGAFYHHFQSKQALFLALLESWLVGLDERIDAAVRGTQNVPTALVTIAGQMRGVFEDAGGRLPMFLEFWNQASHDPTVWAVTVAPYRRYQKTFAAIIKKGMDEGSFEPGDADTVSRILVSLAVGTLLQGVLDPQGARWDEVTQEGVRVLINGLVRKAA